MGFTEKAEISLNWIPPTHHFTKAYVPLTAFNKHYANLYVGQTMLYSHSEIFLWIDFLLPYRF